MKIWRDQSAGNNYKARKTGESGLRAVLRGEAHPTLTVLSTRGKLLFSAPTPVAVQDVRERFKVKLQIESCSFIKIKFKHTRSYHRGQHQPFCFSMAFRMKSWPKSLSWVTQWTTLQSNMNELRFFYPDFVLSCWIVTDAWHAWRRLGSWPRFDYFESLKNDLILKHYSSKLILGPHPLLSSLQIRYWCRRENLSFYSPHNSLNLAQRANLDSPRNKNLWDFTIRRIAGCKILINQN